MPDYSWKCQLNAVKPSEIGPDYTDGPLKSWLETRAIDQLCLQVCYADHPSISRGFWSLSLTVTFSANNYIYNAHVLHYYTEMGQFPSPPPH